MARISPEESADFIRVKSVAKDGHKKGAGFRSFLNYHVFEKTH